MVLRLIAVCRFTNTASQVYWHTPTDSLGMPLQGHPSPLAVSEGESGVCKRRTEARKDNSPKVRPQGLNVGVAPSGSALRPAGKDVTKVTVSTPAGNVAFLSLTKLRAWHNLRNVGARGCHWLGFTGTFVLQFPEWFTPRRLHTWPYASMKCLPCVRIPPVIPRNQ